MSVIVNGILNSTIGLLCSKLRDYAAEKLDDGDLTDAACRQIIVREIDDIKSKLDGLSRKDLLASLSFFKEGVTRLYISFQTSDHCDNASTSKECIAIEDEGEVRGASAVTSVDQLSDTKCEALKTASELSTLVKNLNIVSQERYKLAKNSFNEARRLATEAFNNVALTTEDRIMASKLRIASRILEGLGDTEAALQDCLLYLKELHDLSAVQSMFSVWIGSGKGITSHLRARFNKIKRNDNIKSIHLINAALVRLAITFEVRGVCPFNWPQIKTGKRSYHPLFESCALRKKISDDVPWSWEVNSNIGNGKNCALTSKGELLKMTTSCIETITNDGPKMFFTVNPENYTKGSDTEVQNSEKSDDDFVLKHICCFAVDKNDNVYVVVKITSGYENAPIQYKLLTLNANGNVKADRFLKVIDNPIKLAVMRVTKNGKLVIYDSVAGIMFICDVITAKYDYKFPLTFIDELLYNANRFSLNVSNKNEIIIGLMTTNGEFYMYIVTIDGKLTRRVHVHVSDLEISAYVYVNVIFNHVNETILISVYAVDWIDCSDDDVDNNRPRKFKIRKLIHFFNKKNDSSDSDTDTDSDDDSSNDIFRQTHLLVYSNSGEFLNQFKIPGAYTSMISHEKGPIFFIEPQDEVCKVYMLQV